LTKTNGRKIQTSFILNLRNLQDLSQAVRPKQVTQARGSGIM
jgi:hypothetical protein